MSQSPCFLFAGGGTGGHLFPGIAVAEELLSRCPNARLCFAGSERDVERRIVAEAGYQHVTLPAPPSTWIRRRPVRFLLRYWKARRSAGALLEQLQPAAIVGLGGFASVPVVVAARRRGIPIVLLEQNAVAGRATQWLSRYADAVCHSFESAVAAGSARGNELVTGNPVRRDISALMQARPMNGTTLLVLGGSQGSTAVNDAMLQAAKLLRTELGGWRIVHQCGHNPLEQLMGGYANCGLAHEVAPFFDDLPARYARAGIVVSRAGATTLAELACGGLPAVLIPYPGAVRDHQMKNAQVFAEAGAAAIIEQNSASASTADSLARALRPLLADAWQRRRCSMAMRGLARPRAAVDVARCVLHAAGIQASEIQPPHFVGEGSTCARQTKRTRPGT